MDRLFAEIQNTAYWEVLSTQQGAIDDSMAESLLKMIASALDRDIDEIRDAVSRMLGDARTPHPAITSESQYRLDEYNAFRREPAPDNDGSVDFHIEIRDPSDYEIFGLKGVTLVHRLREVGTHCVQQDLPD